MARIGVHLERRLLRNDVVQKLELFNLLHHFGCIVIRNKRGQNDA